MQSCRVVLLDHPDNLCFGCSPHNEHGLRLVWISRGAEGVEARYTAPDHLRGAPGVIHEALDSEDIRSFVTADFNLSYRRPARCGEALVLRGRWQRSEGRDHFAEGEILDGEGTVLTRASARWREITVE